MTRRHTIPPAVMIDTDDGSISRVTDEELAKAPFIICMHLTSPMVLPDNHVGTCSLCRRAVQFRPGSAVIPVKLCMNCAADWRPQ